jgi:hypothetical protein
MRYQHYTGSGRDSISPLKLTMPSASQTTVKRGALQGFSKRGAAAAAASRVGSAKSKTPAVEAVRPKTRKVEKDPKPSLQTSRRIDQLNVAEPRVVKGPGLPYQTARQHQSTQSIVVKHGSSAQSGSRPRRTKWIEVEIEDVCPHCGQDIPMAEDESEGDEAEMESDDDIEIPKWRRVY